MWKIRAIAPLLLLAALGILAWSFSASGRGEPTWIEVQPGGGSDVLAWRASGPATRTPLETASVPAQTDSPQLLVRAGFADAPPEVAIFQVASSGTGTWDRIYGSARIRISREIGKVVIAPPVRSTLALGVLGMVQVLFLPGFLVLRVFGFRLRLPGHLVTAFGLSLLINSFLVAALAVAGRYGTLSMRALFVLETALLALLLLRGKPDSASCRQGGLGPARSILMFWAELSTPLRIAWVLATAGFLATLIWWAAIAGSAFGEVFTAWDAVNSWNRWALTLAHGGDVWGGLYPQLLPRNLSIPYAMTGTDIELFSRALMPFFTLAILLGMLDLALVLGNPGYLLAAPVCALLLQSFLGPLVTAGYAELPVAFLGFAGVHALLRGNATPHRNERIQAAYLAAALFAGAALAKQAGLFLILAAPLLTWLLLLRSEDVVFSAQEAKRILIRSSLLGLALIAPDYLLKLLLLALGKMEHNLVLLTQTIHGGRNGWERLIYSIRSMREALGPLFFWLLCPGSLATICVLRKRGVLVWGVLLPFFLLWAFFFSYNLRNFALAIPPMALALGLGAAATLRLDHGPAIAPGHGASGSGIRPSSARFFAGTLLALSGAILFAGGGILHKERLLAMQDEASTRILFPSLNSRLLDSYRTGELVPPLVCGPYHITNVWILRNILAVPPIDDPLRSPESLALAINGKRANAILYRPSGTPSATGAYIDALLASGDWRLAWELALPDVDLNFRLAVRNQPDAAPASP